MVNAIRSGTKDDEYVQEYEDIEQYIFSFAKEFGLEKLVEREKEDQKFFPTRELEESEVMDLIDDYDEKNFWEELINRLGERDFERFYGVKNIKKMSLEERIKKDHHFFGKYREEIEKNGLENLEIKEVE